MENVIINFFDLKSRLLINIVEHGYEGMPESLVFKNLHDEAKHSRVFDYRQGLTPDKLLDSLIIDGDIVKICVGDFTECRFVASERYFWKV